MFGWFRRKKPAPPAPPSTGQPLPVVVRAVGAATTGRKRHKGPSFDEVMSAAILEAARVGEFNDQAKVRGWMNGARATLKAARAEMEATGKPVTFQIGERAFTVEPG